MDTLEVLKILELKEKSNAIIDYGVFYVYKNELYNNSVDYHVNLPGTSYTDPINRITTHTYLTSFYQKLLNNSFKVSDKQVLYSHYRNILSGDSLHLFDLQKKNIVILTKKVNLVFGTFECQINSLNDLASWSVHGKLYERELYFSWNKRYIIPLK